MNLFLFVESELFIYVQMKTAHEILTKCRYNIGLTYAISLDIFRVKKKLPESENIHKFCMRITRGAAAYILKREHTKIIIIPPFILH